MRRFLWPLMILPLALLAASACTNGSGNASSDSAPGVSDTEILLGTHLPLSNSPAAAYGPIADGMRAYFNYINDTEGGVYGRKIKLDVGDDHYTPADTVEVVRKLVEQDKVFAIVGGLGDETHLAVWKYLEQRGVPDVFISSGISEWTDPVVSTRFGGNPVYSQEGKMLGQYIAKTYPGKKLGLLLQNDIFGQEGEAGIRAGLAGSGVQIVGRETYEAIQFDTTAQTQRLKSDGAEVLAVYAIPPPAASLVRTAREVLNWDVPIVVTGVDATELFIDLAGQKNAEGVVSVLFGHQAYETDVPGVKQFRDNMQRYAPSVQVNNIVLYGYVMGELTVQGLKNAGKDLTRKSFVHGLESVRKYQCSVCLAPVSMSATDHRPIEIEKYVRVTNGRWQTFGDLVDFESTKN